VAKTVLLHFQVESTLSHTMAANCSKSVTWLPHSVPPLSSAAWVWNVICRKLSIGSIFVKGKLEEVALT